MTEWTRSHIGAEAIARAASDASIPRFGWALAKRFGAAELVTKEAMRRYKVTRETAESYALTVFLMLRKAKT